MLTAWAHIAEYFDSGKPYRTKSVHDRIILSSYLKSPIIHVPGAYHRFGSNLLLDIMSDFNCDVKTKEASHTVRLLVFGGEDEIRTRGRIAPTSV